ncbi:MAG: hypothetical protein N2D54_07595 [Chloroflexota bacterium]
MMNLLTLLFQEPAETTDFMLLGFFFIFVPMALHVWSLSSRQKRLQADMEMIKELED